MKNFNNISDVLKFWGTKKPNKIFIIDGKKNYSFSEINHFVNSCCFFFKSLGLKERDIVSFNLKNSIEFVIIYFACIRSNIVANPLPHTISETETLEKVKFLKSKYLFSDRKIKKKKNFFLVEKKNKTSFIDIILKSNLNKNNYFTKINNKNTAVLYYSSGTTNNPKIIEYSYRSMINLQIAMSRIKFTGPNTTHLCILPMGHTSVLRYSIKQSLFMGSTFVILNNFWEIKNKFWNIIDKYNINYVQLVPSIVTSLITIKTKNFKKRKIKFGCGSDKIDFKVKKFFEKKFKTKLLNLYGLSEIGASHFQNKDNDKENSIGTPLDIYKCKIFKKKNKIAQKNKIGELGVKGTALFNGYYKNKILTKQSFNKFGYFLTGDLCSKDENNNFFYHGRKKDLIIKGGVNINPNEIDEVVKEYSPVIERSATIGIDDEFLGQKIKTFLKLKNKKISINLLHKYLAKKLGHLKKPDEVVIIKKFPTTSTGKVIKRFLK